MDQRPPGRGPAARDVVPAGEAGRPDLRPRPALAPPVEIHACSACLPSMVSEQARRQEPEQVYELFDSLPGPQNAARYV